MRHKYNLPYALIVLLCVVVSFASCKTTPPPRPEEPKRSENLASEVEQARTLAIEKGADKTHAELFKIADKRLNAAKAIVEKDRNGAIKEFAELTFVYKTLANLAEVSALKGEIDEMGFKDKNAEMYERAEKLYKEALDKCSKDGKSAFKASEDALSLYGEICDAGYAELIEAAKNEAKIAKERCDSVKASRSMASEYNKAVKLYNQGSASAKEKHYRDAYKSYISARDVFNSTFKMAEDKKREAEAALARARAKMKESSSLAKEADKASPLKDGTKGFGELDSSSLENKDSNREDVVEIAD